MARPGRERRTRSARVEVTDTVRRCPTAVPTAPRRRWRRELVAGRTHQPRRGPAPTTTTGPASTTTPCGAGGTTHRSGPHGCCSTRSARPAPPDIGAACVLDAGCGTGLAGAALRAAGFGGRLIGIDLSPASLELAADARRLRRPRRRPTCRRRCDSPTTPSTRCSASVCSPTCPTPRRSGASSPAWCVPGGAIVCTQRADVWDERRCHATLDRLERDGTWTATAPQPAGRLHAGQRRLRPRDRRAVPRRSRRADLETPTR